MNKTRTIVINVFLPIIFGGFIYILFRPTNIVLFDWFNTLGLESLISYIRLNTELENNIPFWFKYNLPDGLWVYALTYLMLIIWDKEDGINKFFWILFGPFFGCFIELGQFYNFIAGTFDYMDLIFSIFSGFICFLSFRLQENIIKRF